MGLRRYLFRLPLPSCLDHFREILACILCSRQQATLSPGVIHPLFSIRCFALGLAALGPALMVACTVFILKIVVQQKLGALNGRYSESLPVELTFVNLLSTLELSPVLRCSPFLSATAMVVYRLTTAVSFKIIIRVIMPR